MFFGRVTRKTADASIPRNGTPECNTTVEGSFSRWGLPIRPQLPQGPGIFIFTLYPTVGSLPQQSTNQSSFSGKQHRTSNHRVRLVDSWRRSFGRRVIAALSKAMPRRLERSSPTASASQSTRKNMTPTTADAPNGSPASTALPWTKSPPAQFASGNNHSWPKRDPIPSPFARLEIP